MSIAGSTQSDKSAQHTPGPWEVGYSGSRKVVRRSGHGYPLVTLDEATEADASLIAAAPDLLADAKQAYSALTWLAEQMNSITDNARHWSVEQIRALAQDLRLGIEQQQKRLREIIARAESQS